MHGENIWLPWQSCSVGVLERPRDPSISIEHWLVRQFFFTCLQLTGNQQHGTSTLNSTDVKSAVTYSCTNKNIVEYWNVKCDKPANRHVDQLLNLAFFRHHTENTINWTAIHNQLKIIEYCAISFRFTPAQDHYACSYIRFWLLCLLNGIPFSLFNSHTSDTDTFIIAEWFKMLGFCWKGNLCNCDFCK